MSYAGVTEIGVDRIPVVDVRSLFGETPEYFAVGKALRRAAEDVGFFYVSGHCIDAAATDAAFDAARRLFAAKPADLERVAARDYHRGYLGMGGARMESQVRPDLKESFIWGVDFAPDNPDFVAGNELMPPNRWPEALPGLKTVLLDYLDAAHRCGKELLRAIAASMDVDTEYFIGTFDKPISRGSLIHYPPQPPTMGEDQFGVSPHTDYGTLTLLAQDMTGGLRVQSINGEWLTAHPIADTLVVNVGDLLARWSNDRFRSTPHAVVNSSGKERYSIAIAMDPNWNTMIKPLTLHDEPAHYDAVQCGEYIRGRFDRSFTYRGQMADPKA